MTQAPVSPSGPICVETPERPPPAPWMWPAIVAVAFVPFVLTALGLAFVAQRSAQRSATEAAAPADAAPPVLPAPAPPSVVEVPSAPEPVDPGEARPPIPGLRPAVAEPAPEPIATAASPKCDRFGTAIDFVRSPALAFKQAGREEKLVMVLHIAGHFDDPGFT